MKWLTGNAVSYRTTGYSLVTLVTAGGLRFREYKCNRRCSVFQGTPVSGPSTLGEPLSLTSPVKIKHKKGSNYQHLITLLLRVLTVWNTHVMWFYVCFTWLLSVPVVITSASDLFSASSVSGAATYLKTQQDEKLKETSRETAANPVRRYDVKKLLRGQNLSCTVHTLQTVLS